MKNGIQYLKTAGRMPIRREPVFYIRDVQQDIPVNWCEGCRRELYNIRQRRCRRCKGGD